jgi:hypothetical protein
MLFEENHPNDQAYAILHDILLIYSTQPRISCTGV